MPPDNEIGKLLPIWPIQPMKGPREAQNRKPEVQRKSGGGRRRPEEQKPKDTVDKDGHIDFYA